MFKSKIDFNAFDKNNDKVKDLELTKVKALSKSASKKLQAQPETKTPFHLILDYFKDEKDKALGHFIDFGENKKLSKHFSQVEMKSGKQDKRMSANPKEAAAGHAYAKAENGKMKLYFEPDPNCKVPKGKWPKILKGLKAFLGGLKGVVVINGEVVGEEEEETGNIAVEDAPNEEAGIRGLLGAISKELKQTLPKDILPKIKSKTVQPEDGTIVDDILGQIGEFVEKFETATQPVKDKLQSMYDTVQKQVPQVEKIRDAIENLLGISDQATETPQEDTSLIDELLRLAQEGIGEFDKRYDQLQQDLETESQTPIEGGQELLDQLN